MIKAVYVFDNGMVMVFNENGEQVSHLQGRWREMIDKIHAEADDKTEWHGVAKPMNWGDVEFNIGGEGAFIL